jgi:hypothetical protein
LKRTSEARVLHVRGAWAQPSGARPRLRFLPAQTDEATSIKRSKDRVARPESIAWAAV